MAPFRIEERLISPEKRRTARRRRCAGLKRGSCYSGLPIASFELKKRILRTERIIYGDPTRIDGDPANLGTKGSVEGHASVAAESMGMPSEPGPSPSPTARFEIKIEEARLFIPGEKTGYPPG
jgi:hypothetical protein